VPTAAFVKSLEAAAATTRLPLLAGGAAAALLPLLFALARGAATTLFFAGLATRPAFPLFLLSVLADFCSDFLPCFISDLSDR
jgi:hypothetical protein